MDWLTKLSPGHSIRSYIGVTLLGLVCLLALSYLPTQHVMVITDVATELIEKEVRLLNRSVTSPNITKWRSEPEIRHIAVLKIHKTASSTMLNIMYRFSLERNLNLVLPQHSNNLDLLTPNIIPLDGNATYDVLCNHVTFNYSLFSKFLPNDTFYIGIVREPLKRLHSAFWYYDYVDYLNPIHARYGSKAFLQYLNHIHLYEPKDPNLSQTNNRMAIDFGFDPKHLHNTSLFSTYITHLDNVIDFVIITEYFDESLVLLRRILNWPIKAILHFSQNRLMTKPKLSLNDDQRRKAKHFLDLDYMLYNHYLQRFKNQVTAAGEEFQIEVRYFKRINKMCYDFCISADRLRILHFSESDLSEGFNITHHDCYLMQKEEMLFLNYVRDRLRHENKYINQWAFFATHREYNI